MQKIKQTQAEIELVKDQLHKNIDAIQERGENLDNLQNKTGQLPFPLPHEGAADRQTHCTSRVSASRRKRQLCVGRCGGRT